MRTARAGSKVLDGHRRAWPDPSLLQTVPNLALFARSLRVLSASSSYFLTGIVLAIAGSTLAR